MGITVNGVLTLAGLMIFSKYPQTYFPQLCITAVALPGTEMGTTGNDGERFIDNVREAILNALIHRDYSIHTENVPIRIEMYRNRMEITNSGGLYGKITIDVLGKVQELN